MQKGHKESRKERMILGRTEVKQDEKKESKKEKMKV